MRGPNAARPAGEWREPCHYQELRVQPALRYVDVDFLAFANYYFTYWNVLDKTDGNLRTERYQFDVFVNKMQVTRLSLCLTDYRTRSLVLLYSTCEMRVLLPSSFESPRLIRITSNRAN